MEHYISHQPPAYASYQHQSISIRASASDLQDRLKIVKKRIYLNGDLYACLRIFSKVISDL
jgi:hypothetical protein